MSARFMHKCLNPVSVSQMSCDSMYIIQMPVSQVSVSQMPVGETIFDQKTSSLSQNLVLTCLSTTELMKKKPKKVKKWIKFGKKKELLHNFVNSLGLPAQSFVPCPNISFEICLLNSPYFNIHDPPLSVSDYLHFSIFTSTVIFILVPKYRQSSLSTKPDRRIDR